MKDHETNMINITNHVITFIFLHEKRFLEIAKTFFYRVRSKFDPFNIFRLTLGKSFSPLKPQYSDFLSKTIILLPK